MAVVATVSLAGQVPSAAAERGNRSVALIANTQPDQIRSARVTFRADGQLKLAAEGTATAKRPVKVDAQMDYDERILRNESTETDAPSHYATQSVRRYRRAQAKVTIDDATIDQTLRKDREMIAVQRSADGTTTEFSPLGPLNRHELDLIDVPGNSLVIDRLLPGKTLGVQQQWDLHDPSVLAGLLGLDAVEAADVKCVVDRIEADWAMIHLQGTVRGAIDGVDSRIRLAAKYRYLRRRQMIDWLALSTREDRSIGHAQPGLDVGAQLTIHLSPKNAAPELADPLLEDLQLTASDSALLLEFTADRAGLAALLDRNWNVMVDREDVCIFRLVDRGTLMAQCNLSPLDPVAQGETFTMVDFQADVKRALDDHFGQFVGASESRTDSGLHVMRVVVTGLVQELPVQWIYYHLTHPDGRRASCVFTLESELVERFGAADQTLIATVRFLPKSNHSAGTVASQPDSARRQ